MNIGLGALYKLQLRLPHPDNLYFLHTPKTAGTTVTEYQLTTSVSATILVAQKIPIIHFVILWYRRYVEP